MYEINQVALNFSRCAYYLCHVDVYITQIINFTSFIILQLSDFWY